MSFNLSCLPLDTLVIVNNMLYLIEEVDYSNTSGVCYWGVDELGQDFYFRSSEISKVVSTPSTINSDI